MGFMDFNNFHSGGYSAEGHAYRVAEKEANEKFASHIAKLKVVWGATPETTELWDIKGPEARTAPYEDPKYYYWRRLDEAYEEEGPRMDEARRHQKEAFAAWELYLEAKTVYEAEKSRLKEIAFATPEAEAYFGLIKEREAWLSARKTVLEKEYSQAYRDAGRPEVWPL